MTFTYSITHDFNWQNDADWQAPDTPFMSFAFWQALNDTGAIGKASGWLPFYIIVQNGKSPIAVMPVFIKSHHRGEYVFDHAWAQAYAQYAVNYYPRLVTSVPFTPITGQRIWLAKSQTLTTKIMAVLMQAVDSIAAQTGASSWHGLFMNQNTVNIAAKSQPSLLKREGCQFLWQNQHVVNDNKPFESFDEFLATLTAKKRKNIKAERKKVTKQNIRCELKTGDEIIDKDWTAFYHCYVMTYAVRGQQPYLTSAFFEQLGELIAENIMLAQAFDEHNEVVASSLFLYDHPSSNSAITNSTTLYGRYWGALDEYDSLHFELCYYQGIEFAIRQGLQFFDPGTQGEHKLVRGFVPTKTNSLHRVYDNRFEPAIADFCDQDREHMRQYRQQAHDALPFNINNMPPFKG